MPLSPANSVILPTGIPADLPLQIIESSHVEEVGIHAYTSVGFSLSDRDWETGKSYMAAQISGNAQRMGYNVYYFDSESAISSEFLEKCGCIIDEPGAEDGDFVYIQAQNVEFVLETIEAILASGEENNLFVWDSLALTPAIADLESDFNPQSTMAVKPRILSKGLAKLLQPISNSNSALLVLNQLKDNITRSPAGS